MKKRSFKELNTWDQLRRCVEYYMERHPRDKEECQRLLKWIRLKQIEEPKWMLRGD